MHTCTSTHICVYVSKNMIHQFLPFKSNTSEFIITLHYATSIFALPSSNSKKTGLYYREYTYLFAQFPHVVLIFWSQRPSLSCGSTDPACCTCWSTVPCTAQHCNTTAQLDINLLCDQPASSLHSLPLTQVIGVAGRNPCLFEKCAELCERLELKNRLEAWDMGQVFSNWDSKSPRGSCWL